MIPIHQIHPMIVHFPIVLFIVVLILDGLIVARGGSLTERTTLPTTAFWLMGAGLVSAVAAAIFGGIAAGRAMDAGFPLEPIGAHQGYAQITVLVFLALAIVRGVCRWRNVALSGGRGWIFTLAMLIGVGLMGLTAYYGGHLVYGLGVNVDVVTPATR